MIINRLNNDSVELHIIASGGKQGLLGISWGAEKSALNKIIKFVDKYRPSK